MEIQKFSLIERNILKLKGMTDEQLDKFESFGLSSKAALAIVGDAETLGQLSDIDPTVAYNVMLWAKDGAVSQPSYATQSQNNVTENIAKENSIPFELKALSIYENWIKEALMENKVDERQLDKFREVYNDVRQEIEDADELYNFGRIITIMMQPALDEWDNDESEAVTNLINTAQSFYLEALSHYEQHGRAHIMYGTQLSQQKNYTKAIPHLEKGLELPEASDDWMQAANWYILANINIGNTFGDVTLLFEKFKNHAVEGSYFAQMAARFESHL